MHPASKHRIVLLHGRGPKPDADALRLLWMDALRAGLQRDAPESLPAFESADVHMVYYAHHLQAFADADFDADSDLDGCRQALSALSSLQKARDFRRKYYEALPGKTPLKEFAMDLSASVGLGGAALRKALPELHGYWDTRAAWPASVREQLGALLRELMASEDPILLISHCMGSVIAWDSLWQLTHQGQPPAAGAPSQMQWITLGSPLATRAVRNRLAGAAERGLRRYPAILHAWHNIAAEDDYVSHDKTVANDFKAMLKHQLIGDIHDHTIYNLSVRNGRSNPHSSLGYLIHPRTTQLLASWLAR